MTAFRFHITFNMVFLGLLDIVNRFPSDHVGTNEDGCAYVSSVEGYRLIPSCIVGQFFADLGLLRMLLVNDGSFCGVAVTTPDGTKYNNMGAMSPDARERLADWGVTMDDDAHALLWNTQINQDAKEPWPIAFEDALTTLIENETISVVRPEVSSVDLVKHTLSL